MKKQFLKKLTVLLVIYYLLIAAELPARLPNQAPLPGGDDEILKTEAALEDKMQNLITRKVDEYYLNKPDENEIKKKRGNYRNSSIDIKMRKKMILSLATRKPWMISSN